MENDFYGKDKKTTRKIAKDHIIQYLKKTSGKKFKYADLNCCFFICFFWCVFLCVFLASKVPKYFKKKKQNTYPVCDAYGYWIISWKNNIGTCTYFVLYKSKPINVNINNSA